MPALNPSLLFAADNLERVEQELTAEAHVTRSQVLALQMMFQNQTLSDEELLGRMESELSDAISDTKSEFNYHLMQLNRTTRDQIASLYLDLVRINHLNQTMMRLKMEAERERYHMNQSLHTQVSDTVRDMAARIESSSVTLYANLTTEIENLRCNCTQIALESSSAIQRAAETLRENLVGLINNQSIALVQSHEEWIACVYENVTVRLEDQSTAILGNLSSRIEHQGLVLNRSLTEGGGSAWCLTDFFIFSCTRSR